MSIRTIPCSSCGAKVATVQDLQVHMASMHPAFSVQLRTETPTEQPVRTPVVQAAASSSATVVNRYSSEVVKPTATEQRLSEWPSIPLAF